MGLQDLLNAITPYGITFIIIGGFFGILEELTKNKR